MLTSCMQAHYSVWRWAWALAPRGMRALQRAGWMVPADEAHRSVNEAVRRLLTEANPTTLHQGPYECFLAQQCGSIHPSPDAIGERDCCAGPGPTPGGSARIPMGIQGPALRPGADIPGPHHAGAPLRAADKDGADSAVLRQ